MTGLTMHKRVILTFDSGNFRQGFSVTLQIGPENQPPQVVVAAQLPADENLERLFLEWTQVYHHLGLGSRPVGLPKREGTATREQCAAAAIALRHQFNTWFRQPEVSPLRDAWLTHLNRDDVLRVVLQTEDRQIQRLPWHHWDLLDRFPGAEVALGCRSFAPLDLGPVPPLATVPLLAILGDSRGIDIGRDRQMLHQLPHTNVSFLVEPRRVELTDQLWQQPWRILFFAGHSCTDPDGGRIAINKEETLRLQELKFALKRAVSQGLQLAIFNSCDGLGLAQEFADLNIPQLIVMREPVPDQVAQTFLSYFLAAYTQGIPLYLAVREARERLQGLEDEFPGASGLPIIFQHPNAQPPTWQALLAQPSANAVDLEAIASPTVPSPTLSPPSPPAPTPQLPTAPPSPSQPPPTQTRPKLTLSKPTRSSLSKLFGLSTAIALTLLGIRHLGLLQPLELKGLDWLLTQRPEEPPESRIAIVKVTQADVEAQTQRDPQESLSDAALDQLLGVLEKHQPALIGLDIYRKGDSPSPLTSLSDRLANDPNLIATCRVSQTDNPGFKPPKEVEPHRLGFSDSIPDDDGIQRRQLLAMDLQATSPCPTSYSLSTMLALQYLARQGIQLSNPAPDQLLLGEVSIPLVRPHSGGYQRVDAWGYQTLLNYRSHRGIDNIVPQLTLGQVLQGEFPPQILRDRIILIGTTAESFGDYSPTPYHPQTAGVVLQAQMVSQLLSAVLENRPLLHNPPRWAEYLMILGSVYLGAGSGYLLKNAPKLGFMLLINGGALCFNYGLCLWLLSHAGLWLPWIPTSFGFLWGSLLSFRSHAPPAAPAANPPT